MTAQKLHELLFKFLNRVPKDRPRSYFRLFIVHQESRNPDRPYRQAGLRVHIIVIVIYIPVYGQIRHQIHLCVIQICDLRQIYTGPVSLHPVYQHIVHVVQKHFNRNPFIRIISGNVQTDK